MSLLRKEETLAIKLDALREDRRRLDDEIRQAVHASMADQCVIRRLKERELKLKDEIARVRAKLYPDIIA